LAQAIYGAVGSELRVQQDLMRLAGRSPLLAFLCPPRGEFGLAVGPILRCSRLIGKILVREMAESIASGRIVETEANGAP
jgi:hypothetical protein